MDTRNAFYQSFRELRANGRIGYSVLRNPLVRLAACEALRLRSQEDSMSLVRRRITRLQIELQARGSWGLN